MKNKKIVLAVLALVLVIGVMAGVYLSTRPQSVEGSKQVTIQIVHKDGTEKKLDTGYASEEFGFTIESVDGVVADWAVDGAYWALYEGEEYATASAAGIVLVDGGIYKLVYETF